MAVPKYIFGRTLDIGLGTLKSPTNFALFRSYFVYILSKSAEY
jgi:hypothetical protein